MLSFCQLAIGVKFCIVNSEQVSVSDVDLVFWLQEKSVDRKRMKTTFFTTDDTDRLRLHVLNMWLLFFIYFLSVLIWVICGEKLTLLISEFPLLNQQC